MLLEAVYEPLFHDFSYGFRPGRSAHQALACLGARCLTQNTQWVVDADVCGYFGTIGHDWLTRMLVERIDDGPFPRLIRKWLEAGILETDGQVTHPVTGTRRRRNGC